MHKNTLRPGTAFPAPYVLSGRRRIHRSPHLQCEI